MKQKNLKQFYTNIKTAKKLKAKVSGPNFNQRRHQILEKYIKSQFIKVLQANKKPAAQPGQAPSMDMTGMIIRFGPMLLSKMLFSDAPGAILYLPFVAKLEQKDDKILQLLLKVVAFGKKQDDEWKPGYIGRTFFSFLFGFLFKKILTKILYGSIPSMGIMEKAQLMQELNGAAEKKKGKKINFSGNGDLKQILPEIDEISEVDAPVEETNDEEKENSFSGSKM